jgi:hypothetical protein
VMIDDGFFPDPVERGHEGGPAVRTRIAGYAGARALHYLTSFY